MKMKNEKNVLANIDSNLIAAPGVKLNMDVLGVLSTPYVERGGESISPVCFIHKDEDGDVVDSVLALATHPTQFSDFLMAAGAGIVADKELAPQESTAILYSFAHTFKVRVQTEMHNILGYIFNEISIYSNDKGYDSIFKCLRGYFGTRVHSVARDENLVGYPVDYTDSESVKYVEIDFADLSMYGSYITEATIPYLAAAYLSSVVDNALRDEFPSPETIEFINTHIPNYGAMLVAAIKNWLELARYYSFILPEQVHQANL